VYFNRTVYTGVRDLQFVRRECTRQRCIAGCAPGTFSRHTRLVSAPATVTTNTTQQGRALLCARRRNDVTRCNVIDMFPHGPLCVNLTSSTKPEVHNISQRRQGSTEPLPQVRCTKICRRLGVQFPRYAGGQTNTRTDTIDTILRYLPLPGAE